MEYQRLRVPLRCFVPQVSSRLPLAAVTEEDAIVADASITSRSNLWCTTCHSFRGDCSAYSWVDCQAPSAVPGPTVLTCIAEIRRRGEVSTREFFGDPHRFHATRALRGGSLDASRLDAPTLTPP